MGIARMAMDELGCWYGSDPFQKRRFQQSVARTGVGYTGSAGGFALPVDVSNRVLDHARALSAVWGLVKWVRTSTREWLCPVPAELSRVPGSQFGGFQATWGLGETTMPTATDGRLSRVRFVNNRCLLVTQISRDVFEDAESVRFWVQEAGYKTISALMEHGH
jgi:HK97 family phage major capsid protein